MKAWGRKVRVWIRESWFGVALLTLYALALFLSDPEWAMWAGGMSAGVLSVPETLPPRLLATNDLFAGAGGLSLLGLGAFAILLCETFHGIGCHKAIHSSQIGRR